MELHGFEWAAHTDDHAAWLLPQERIIHSSDLINPDQPPFGSSRAMSVFAGMSSTSGRSMTWSGTTCPVVMAISALERTSTSSSRS